MVMGKRRKISSDTTSNEGHSVLPHGVSEDKTKKKTVADCNDILKPEDNLNNSEVKEVKQRKKSKKNNPCEVVNTEIDPTVTQSDVVSDNPYVTEDKTEKRHQSSKKSKRLSQETEESTESSPHDNLHNRPSVSSQVGKSKKIIFINDQPQEVSDAPQVVSKTKQNRNEKNQFEEEEVNDEDIDKFCDELTEEDNVQYDNWIKLVEAKMHPNKKN